MSGEAERIEPFHLESSGFETELERSVFAVVTDSLYKTTERAQIQKLHSAASKDEIDAVLTSPAMKRRISQSVEAFLQQQLPALLNKIFRQADEGQSWACKVVLELTGIAELLRAAVSRADGGIEELQVISELERGLVESFRQLAAGEGREEAQQDARSE